ncbi:MAG: glutamate--tRNA ligase [Candidatus Bathyarchaeota archaeon]|nr:MAG: glutamate--tRNA ligase [Candidatus Bathyarchaeota archaeon]
MTSNETREVVHKIALLNALQYGGEARVQSVLGKLLAERPHLKGKIKEIASMVEQVVQEVNKLSLEKQKRIVEKRWPKALVKEKIEEKKKLPPLPNVEKYERVITRFSPNPDCALHLGSARAIVLCYEYAKMYDGLFYLRFEDTDPRLKKSALPFYDFIREDLTWLGCNWDREVIQSDRLSIYYEHVEKLLKKEHAYVCICPREEFRDKVKANEPCPCRHLAPEEQIARWRRMLNGTYREGGAVVRVKTDLNHPNPAVRDWPAFRIIDPERHPHPRVGSKYRVWPLYNFACGVDDHLMGVTHIIRGKEHLTNQTRQEYMYRHFGWRYPEAIHYGRLKITRALLSKSKILEGFRSGLFRQWDDPRLATLAALRRRGIKPEAIRRLIIDVGPKTADVMLSWENLYAHNRKIIDPVATRYFFVHNPRKLTVKNVPHAFTAQIPLHPDWPEKGFRRFKIRPEDGEALFWVSDNDQDILGEGKTVRFMGLFNLKIEGIEKQLIETVFHSEAYEEAKKLSAPLIHWIPADTGIPCEVVMPDASVANGIAEDACKKLRPNEVVQFERFGFVRIDSLEKKLTACFTHR